MKPLFVGYTNPSREPDNQAPGRRRKLFLSEKDLITHIHGVGATRSGKSKWIEWFCRQIERQDVGFTLIDPQGALSEDLIHYFAYARPKRPIVYFHPSREDYVVPFNPFRAGEGEISTRVARQVEATLRVWGAENADETPTLNRLLYSMFYLFSLGVLSLNEAYDILSSTNQELRRYAVEFLDDYPIVQSTWRDLAEMRPRDFRQEVLSAQNRFFKLVQSPQVRRIMGLEDSLDFADIFEKGAIVIVNLEESECLSAENASLIGTLMINELWTVARRRTRPPQKPYFLLIDEVQRFFTPDLKDILDRGAGKGLHLGLFHQHLTQLEAQDKWTYDSVMGNARVKLAFGGLTRENARIMVDEIFAGQIDLNEIKFLIEQTKFWPTYGRDKTYTRSHSFGSSSSWGSGEVTGEVWDEDLQTYTPATSSAALSESETRNESYSEGETDIPIFYQIPFKEVSSETVYTLEEQKHRLADELKEQFQRHYFLKRTGQPTVAAVTPFVKSYQIYPEREEEYTLERLIRPYALSVAEVDQRLAEQRKRLLEAARAHEGGSEIEPVTRE